MKTDTYNVNNNPPGSPHEVRRAPRAQPTSALRAHTPCWLAMAWSFLNCSSTFSTIFIRAASRRYSSAVCLLELMSLRCSSVRASGRLPHLRPRSGRKKSKDGQEAHSKLKKEVKKGSGKCANGPVDHTCNASLLAGRPRFFSAGSQPSVRQQPRLRHPPIWHGLAGPEHAALLVTIVRAALLPVHHYLPRAAARLLSMCAKAVRFPAGAWPPITGEQRSPGQARRGRAF